MIVIRVEHFNQISGEILLFYRFFVITLVKRVELKGLFWLRIPDHQCIYNIIIVSDDRHIVWDRHDRLVIFMDETCSSGLIRPGADIAAEFYFIGMLRSL